MPYLGDYIGYLLSEITIARMHADLEAVRIAELYSDHPLLRNMPIPHFRLPHVEMDIPVVVKQMEEQPEEELPKGAPSLTDMRNMFDTVVGKILVEDSIRLKPDARKRLKLKMDRKIIDLYQPREVAIDTNRVADELSKTASEDLTETGGLIDPSRQPELEERLKKGARTEFHKLRKPIPRLHVLVTTSEIREAGPSENILRINLKITEEGFEWTTIESEGKRRDKLVIE